MAARRQRQTRPEPEAVDAAPAYTKVRMLRAVKTGGDRFYHGEVYDLPAERAASWIAYGVCEAAE